MTVRWVKDYIADLETELAKQKAVFAIFPDAKTHYSKTGEFTSKSVNQKYTNFDFFRCDSGVWVLPYCEVKIPINDKFEIVRVYSSPKTNRLVYLSYSWRDKSSIIKFSRLAFNLKNNHFKDDMLNACRVEIMDFVKKNSKFKMDDKHLEPRLKKLLIFT